MYFILFLFLAVTAIYFCVYKKTETSKIIFLTLNGIFLILISSFRYEIGYDYRFYKTMFYEIAKTPFMDIFSVYHKELAFVLINKAISFVGGNYIIFLFTINSFMTFIVMRFIYKYSNNIWLSVFLYITLQMFAHSMNLLRQSIAATFLLIAWQFLIERKLFKYLLVIILGASFHMSALILIPFYFILAIKVSFKNIIITLLFVVFTYVFFDYIFLVASNYFLHDYEHYINSIYWNGNSIKYIVFPFIYAIYTLSLKISKKEIDFKTNVFINSSLYLFYISMFITKHFIIERLSIYFYFLSMLVIPEIVNCYKNNFKKKIAIGAVISIGLLYFAFAANEGFHNVYPYFSIFDIINF